VPVVFDAVTIGQVQAWNEAKDDIAKFIAITGLEHKIVRQFPIEQIRKINTDFEALLGQQKRVFKRHLIIKVPAKVGTKSIRIGFIPDVYRMTQGEYTDAVTYCDPKNYNGNLHKLMGIFYRPITKKFGKQYRVDAYEPAFIKENAEAYKAIPVMYLNGALAFFLTLREQLAESSQRSFQRELTNSLKEMTSELRQARHSANNGDGITS
jgi:hypothetical protein